jgi:GDPmannose 4,6-dehydratase
MKTALITGITGQDGSYLAEFLLKQDYEVHGIIRRASVFTSERIDHILQHPRLKLHHGDLNDSSNLFSLVHKINPDEVYHLGAQSHVGVSFEVPEYTGDVSGLGTLRLLNAIKLSEKPTKFYNAATSEMFGGLPGTSPQSESTPFHPRSPYGAAKLYSFWLSVNYREAFNLFISNGILFNHESPRRGETFVTRKITMGVSQYVKSGTGVISLGNLDAVRDWGFAGDYVEAMWEMLQHTLPDDFVIATGRGCSVREFATLAFQCAGVEVEWEGTGKDEFAIDVASNKKVVVIDQRYFRPSEVDLLIGDAEKARSVLNWLPATALETLIEMMVRSDIDKIK